MTRQHPQPTSTTTRVLPCYRRADIHAALRTFIDKFVDDTIRTDHAAECANCGELTEISCGRRVSLGGDEFAWAADRLIDELCDLEICGRRG